jgi:glycosyltransferase involved in cell wall biosynthesis
VTSSAPRIVALVAARDEARTIASTVTALSRIAGVTEVVVVDDGSRDTTTEEALAAGARTVHRGTGRGGTGGGKGGALEGALRRLPDADIWVLADADLGSSASSLAGVLEPVRAGHADLAIGVPPPQGGGFGLVRRVAGVAIRTLAGLRTAAPLSGQRAITGRALSRVRPLAGGFGVETAMTIDAVRSGARVVEVPVAIVHRATGRDLAGFAHRGRQGIDIVRAVASRLTGRRALERAGPR